MQPVPEFSRSHLTRVNFSSIVHIKTNIVGEDTVDEKAARAYLVDCRARNLAQESIDDYVRRLRVLRDVAGRFGKSALTIDKADIRAWLFDSMSRLSPVTVRGFLRAWKTYYRWLESENYIEHSPIETIKMPKVDRRPPPVMSVGQIERILASFDISTFHGRRDFTMTFFLYDTMIRVSELCRIRLADLQPNRTLIIPVAKSRKARIVPISAETWAILRVYLTGHRRPIPGDALFCYEDGEPIHRHRVQQIYREAGERLGFRCYPHLFRHTGATHLADSGIPLRSLQRILGHSKLSTTEQYLHTDDTVMIEHHERYNHIAELIK